MRGKEDIEHAYIESRETHALATSFRAVDGYYRNCDAARYPTVDFQAVFHSQPARLRSIADDLVNFASLLWLVYGLLNQKPAIYVGNMIALAMDVLMVNGILMHAGWTY